MKKAIILITVILCPTIITACGSELDDEAYVIAIGVDEGEYTFAIGNPAGIDGGNGDRGTMVLEAQAGGSVLEAAEAVGARLGKRVSLSHAELLLLSESEILRAEEILEALSERFCQRPQLYAAVSRGSAKEVLSAIDPLLDINPEKYLEKVFEKEQGVSVSGRELLCRTKNKELCSALPCVENKGGAAEINSLTVFDENGVTGWVTDLLSCKIMRGKVKDVSLEVSGFGTLVLNSRARPRAEAECGEKLKIYVELLFDGTVSSLNDGISKEELFAAAEEELEKRAAELLRCSSADFLGLDGAGRKRFLTRDSWENYNWRERYKTAEFSVAVKIFAEKIMLAQD